MDHPLVGTWERREDTFRVIRYSFGPGGHGRRWFEAPGLHSDTALTWRPAGPDRVEIHYGESESSEDGEAGNEDWDLTETVVFTVDGATLTMSGPSGSPQTYTRRG